MEKMDTVSAGEAPCGDSDRENDRESDSCRGIIRGRSDSNTHNTCEGDGESNDGDGGEEGDDDDLKQRKRQRTEPAPAADLVRADSQAPSAVSARTTAPRTVIQEPWGPELQARLLRVQRELPT
jgi:hypothetical protein